MTTETVPYQIIDIALSDIIFPDEEMRSQVSLEGLDELARSIKRVGLLNPISVRRKENKYELIAGYRRTKASEIAGKIVIPARVFESSDELASLQKAHENLFREDVNPVDECAYMNTIMLKNNWILQDLAAAMQKSESYVSRRLRIGQMPEMVRNALRDGQINISIAEELAKIEDEKERTRILYIVINSGASVEVVRQWRVQIEVQKQMNGPVWDERTGSTEGSGAIDPTKPGLLKDDTGPRVELSESTISYRICHNCLKKTKAEEAHLLIMCPECAASIEPYLQGNKNTDEEKLR